MTDEPLPTPDYECPFCERPKRRWTLEFMEDHFVDAHELSREEAARLCALWREALAHARNFMWEPPEES